MNKKLGIGIVVVAIVALSMFAGCVEEETQTPTPTSNVIEISATQLYEDSITNKAAVNLKYLNKTLRVSGEVLGVQKYDEYFLILDATSGGLRGRVFCYPNNPEDLINLREGDRVIIEGRYEDVAASGVTMRNCRLIQSDTSHPALSEISASELWEECSDNAAAVDFKYKDKIVRVTGEVYWVSHDQDNNYYMTFRTKGGSVKCYFNDPNELINLKRGQRITVEGRFKEFRVIEVIIKDCRIV